MAKSFTTPPTHPPQRPLADQDFFDLTTNPAPVELPTPAPLLPAPEVAAAVAAEPPYPGNAGNTRLPDKPEQAAPPGMPDSALNLEQPPYPEFSTPTPAGNSPLPGTRRKPLHPAHSEKLPQPGNTKSGAVTKITEAPEATGIRPATGLPAATSPASYPEGDVRQTFILSQAHLEQLLDHVHARRAAGDYLYSQKQALQQALDLFFASLPGPVAPRPREVRELEQERRKRIQVGRRDRESP